MTLPANSVQINGQGTVSGDQLNTYTQWCPDTPTLRGFIGIGQMLVYLEGTASAGDGGQGAFYWNASSTAPDDNGATTVVPNGSTQGAWTRLPSILTGVVNLNNAINFASAGNIASAATTPIGAATGNFANITGTTAITAFDTVQAGSWRVIRFTGILTLTYNAVSLILPGAANITTAAGDTAEFVSLGSGNWLCVNYTRASGQALVPTPGTVKTINAQSFTSNGTYTPTTNMLFCIVEIQGPGGGGGAVAASSAVAGGGAGAGGYARVLLTAAQIGGSQAITIGTGGNGGASGGNNSGSSGSSATSIGALVSCGPGGGGAGGGTQVSGGSGGTVTVSTGSTIVAIPGATGGVGAAIATLSIGGTSASSPLGEGGGQALSIGTSTNGLNATGYGSGGAGSANISGTSQAGGNGSGGIVTITEYIG